MVFGLLSAGVPLYLQQLRIWRSEVFFSSTMITFDHLQSPWLALSFKDAHCVCEEIRLARLKCHMISSSVMKSIELNVK